MKILANLTATAAEAEWNEPRGELSVLHHQLQPGCFIHISLGAAGIRIWHDQTTIGITTAELIRLIQAHEPALHPQVLSDAAAALRIDREALARQERDTLKLAAKRSPSPINGEGAGVRGEKVECAAILDPLGGSPLGPLNGERAGVRGEDGIDPGIDGVRAYLGY